MLPDIFPERAFSVQYAMKDLSYALEMAAASGLDVAAAELTMARLKRTVESGYGEQYHPVGTEGNRSTMSYLLSGVMRGPVKSRPVGWNSAGCSADGSAAFVETAGMFARTPDLPTGSLDGNSASCDAILIIFRDASP